MFSHVMIGSDDLDRSKTLYDALFTVLGGKPGKFDVIGHLVYGLRGNLFMITRPIDGGAASHGNGGTIGFAVDSPAQGDAWHRAGLEHGATTCEDPPGIRRGDFGALYLAYLRDAEGNKLCALHRMPA